MVPWFARIPHATINEYMFVIIIFFLKKSVVSIKIQSQNSKQSNYVMFEFLFLNPLPLSSIMYHFKKNVFTVLSSSMFD